jgi:hypothetical protein
MQAMLNTLVPVMTMRQREAVRVGKLITRGALSAGVTAAKQSAQAEPVQYCSRIVPDTSGRSWLKKPK